MSAQSPCGVGRRQCLAAVAAFAATAFVHASHAQDAWGGSLSVTNDYRVRGISKSNTDAAIQGGLHAQLLPGWVIGAWASNVSRARRSTLEIDAYTGYGWSIAKDWDAKATFTHYWHPDDPARSSYDYDELSATLAFRSQLFATVAWSPDAKYFARYQGSWQRNAGDAISYELTGLHPLTASLALQAGVGYSDLTAVVDAGYWYWNAGVTYSMGPVQLDISRIDSDATAERLFGATTTEAGWSAAISWRF